jgi:plasmid stabilization system protein ParE
MVNRVEWTQIALAELAQILLYLREKTSSQTAQRFADLVKQKIYQLETNRMEGRRVPTRKTIHFILIGKNHRLYYRKHGATLYITRIYDTRQNPDKSPY